MPYMSINGVDITRYILKDGFSLSENDLDSPKAGRTLDALMHRGKVAQKNKADVKLVPVKKSVLDMLMPLLRNQYFTCKTDLFPGMGVQTMQMYNSTRKYGVAIVDTSGTVWYKDASFNIIER